VSARKENNNPYSTTQIMEKNLTPAEDELKKKQNDCFIAFILTSHAIILVYLFKIC